MGVLVLHGRAQTGCCAGPGSLPPPYPSSRTQLGSRRPFPAPAPSGGATSVRTGPAPAEPGRGIGLSRGPGVTYLPPRRRGCAAAPPYPRSAEGHDARAGEGCGNARRDARSNGETQGAKEGCAEGHTRGTERGAERCKRGARIDGWVGESTERCAEAVAERLAEG